MASVSSLVLDGLEQIAAPSMHSIALIQSYMWCTTRSDRLSLAVQSASSRISACVKLQCWSRPRELVESFEMFWGGRVLPDPEENVLPAVLWRMAASRETFCEPMWAGFGVYEQCFRPAFCWTLCNVLKAQLESKNAPPETLNSPAQHYYTHSSCRNRRCMQNKPERLCPVWEN